MRRLVDDPRMPLALREEMRRSREAGEAYDVLAKLPQLTAALAEPVLQPSSAPSAEATATAAKRGFGWSTLPTSWKLLAIAAIGGSGAIVARLPPREHAGIFARPATTASLVQRSDTAPPPRVANASARPIALLPPSAATPSPGEVPAAAKLEAAEPIETPTHAPRTPDAETAPMGRDSTPRASSSRREIAQLVHVRALLDSNPVAAYRLAQRSEREFPRGNLREERQALLVQALAKAGATDEAARAAREFFTRYPLSPLHDRVDAALQR